MKRVVKIGGSLLERSDLSEQVQQWLNRQSPAQTYFIVGGGEFVEAVRRMDAVHPRPRQRIHWICIELLRVTFDWSQAMFPQWRCIATPQQLEEQTASHATDKSQEFLVAVDAFYREDRQDPWSDLAELLPEDWQTTSDSLAALLAVAMDADELVLLKSCTVPDVEVTELIKADIVDPAFGRIACRVKRLRVEKLALS